MSNKAPLSVEALENLFERALDDGEVKIHALPGGSPYRPRFAIEAPDELEFIAGRSPMDWANKVWRKRRDRLFESNQKDPLKPRIVAIGDSWFHYPFGSDLLEWFETNYALKTLAAAGDVLRRIVADRDYESAITQVKPNFVMLSGGGNDLLGETDGERNIKRMVIDFDPTAGDCLTPEGRKTINWAVDQFEFIRADIKQLGFTGQMVVHGYDYASPPSNGSWLSEPLEEKGYLTDEAQFEVVRQLVDAFNDAIAAWAKNHPDVIHANCAGKNGRGPWWWFDEIHPTMRAYRYNLYPAFAGPMEAWT